MLIVSCTQHVHQYANLAQCVVCQSFPTQNNLARNFRKKQLFKANFSVQRPEIRDRDPFHQKICSTKKSTCPPVPQCRQSCGEAIVQRQSIRSCLCNETTQLLEIIKVTSCTSATVKPELNTGRTSTELLTYY